MSRRFLLFIPLLAALSSPAVAELPVPVRDMVGAAIATGDPQKVSTVIDIAIQTNPDDADELNRIRQAFAEEQAKLAAQKKREEVMEIRQASMFDRWSGNGELGGFLSTGNTDEVGITVAVALERAGIDWTHRLRARGDFRRTNGLTTREQLLAAYEPRYQFSETLFTYALGQFEGDRFQGYDGRYSLSGGLGYKVLDQDGLHMSVKAGPAWRYTEFLDDTSEEYIAGLAALDFGWAFATGVKLTQNAEVYVQHQNSSFLSDTGLEVGLASNLKARMSYSLEHDTDPPPGAEKTDTLSRMSLVYDF